MFGLPNGRVAGIFSQSGKNFMQQGSDLSQRWAMDVYKKVVAPQIIGNADASTYSPHVAPTAYLVCGQDGGNSSSVAFTAARSIEWSGGRPVVIDENQLRRIHASETTFAADPTDVKHDVQSWAVSLLRDAANRRLDVVIASSLTGPDMVERTLDAVSSRGYDVGAIVASTSPGQSKAALLERGVRHSEEKYLQEHDAVCALLPAAVERLDRDRRVGNIRVVNQEGRTLMRAGPERHTRGSYEVREVLTQDWLGMRERSAPRFAHRGGRDDRGR
jgi:Zeta toxin